VTPLALVLLYLIGGVLTAGGIFIVGHRAFPAWLTGRLLWPLVVVTPAIATLQGWATLAFGVALLAFTFGPFAPDVTMAGLRALAAAGAAAGVILFAYSTWLSRRPGAESLPPKT
jgi:hypothetical protein